LAAASRTSQAQSLSAFIRGSIAGLPIFPKASAAVQRTSESSSLSALINSGTCFLAASVLYHSGSIFSRASAAVQRTSESSSLSASINGSTAGLPIFTNASAAA